MKSARKFIPQTDDQNWQALFNKHFQDLQSLNAVGTIWMNGFSRLGIDNSKRPTAEQLNIAAKPYTGFTFVQTGDNIIMDQIDWYGMIADHKMPMTNFVRTPEELHYCDEPDYWHDVMGHIPYLVIPEYVEMYTMLARTYVSAYRKNRMDLLPQLDFIGGLLIELGLIREPSGLKAFGSTFYSSSEVFEAYRKENQIPFSKDALLSGESYDRHSFQGKYYILDSFEQLKAIIADLNQQC
jgi:phenylalanine-4-hydroxylase